MESFKTIFPSVALFPYIKHYWIMEIGDSSAVSERIIPTGCIQMVFHRKNPILFTNSNSLQPQSFVCGQNNTFSDLTTTGKTEMITVVFRPYGAKAFFSIPMDKFYNHEVSLRDIGDKLLAELEEKVMEAKDSNTAINIIEDYLIQQLKVYKEYNYKRITATIEAIGQNSQIEINSLANIACLSYKQFNRIFTEYAGIKPKEFLKIVRFQKALHLLENNPCLRSTDLAFESGYFDQPHMIKEFKQFSGLTPKQFLSFCPPHSDYFNP